MTHEIRSLAQHRVDAGPHSLSDRDRRVIRRVAERAEASGGRASRHAAGRRPAASPATGAIGTLVRSRAFVVGSGLFLATWTIAHVLVLAGGAVEPRVLVGLNLLLGLVAAVAIGGGRMLVTGETRASGSSGVAGPGADLSMAELHHKVERLTARIDALAAFPLEARGTVQAPTRRPALRIV